MNLYTVRNNIMKGIPLQELNLRVCFYARVSTEKDEQINSLKNQITFFNDYINKIPKWEFASSYIDEGISGTGVLKREEFLKMITDAKNGKFDLILTKEISRFSRSTLDSIKYTQELLTSGVGVYFLNDNINSILPDSELRLTIMASVAQDEVRKLSERVSFGMKRSIDNGNVLGCSNIYGYEKDNGKLVINEKEAEMIKIIYDRYANTNDGLSKISKYLYELNYKTKTGKRLDTTIITRIIENPKYKGYYCGNKTKVLDYRTKKKKKLDKDNWIVYKDYDKVPPIVSEELWSIANIKLRKRRKSYLNKIEDKTIFHNRYTYSGKIYCGIHNVTYHRNSAGKRKNNPVWECQVYRRNSLKGCTNNRVNEGELDKLFKSIISKLYFDKKIIFDNLIEYCKNYLLSKNSDSEIKILESKCEVIKNKKDKLLELVMDGYLENIDYKKQIDNLNLELNEYLVKLNNLKNNKYDKYLIEKEINNIRENLEHSIEDDLCLSDIFNSLVEKIVANKDENNPKKIKLDIIFKTGATLKASSNNLGKKYHLEEYLTTFCLINDTYKITRGISSIYTKKYDVEYEYKCLINI